MRALLLALVAAVAVAAATPPAPDSGPIAVYVDPSTGAYNISASGKVFLTSGPTFLRAGGVTYTTANGTLKLSTPGAATQGRDAFGSFTGTVLQWTTAASPAASFTAVVRQYSRFVVFEQRFPAPVTGTSTGDRDRLVSAFPAFDTSTATAQSSMGFLAYNDDMVGDRPASGKWATDALPSGVKAGPTVAFTPDLTTSFVFSSASQFMAWNQVYDAPTVSFGVMGNVSMIPAGYAMETIVFRGAGVNDVMSQWGDVMRARYGKPDVPKVRDATLRGLQYSTDNGAHYYYHTEPNTTYEQTILDVAAYARKTDIPYHSILLDSWWYYQGADGGVELWLARPDVFPHGMDYVFNQTGYLIQAHNRYWSSQTTYATKNGGKWEFAFSEDPKYTYGVPLQYEFWDWLMDSSTHWGLSVYEQDWLDDEFDRVTQLGGNATLARTWMLQMGTAAGAHGVSMQLCMSHTKHVMQALEMARASGDYQPGNSQWRPLGVTSILAAATGIVPTKDNYRSTPGQSGNPKYSNDEPYVRLQAAVSTLSSGPVAPSDKIGCSNRTLIMMSAMSCGTLLQPDQPAMAIDAYFVKAAGVGDGPDGQVWSTHSTVSNQRYTNVFVAELAADYDVPLSALGYASDDTVVVVEANSTTSATVLSGGDTLAAKACDRWDFQLYSVAPVLPGTSVAVVGETAKWVPVNNARFTDVASSSTNGVELRVSGNAGEAVTVSLYDTSSSTMHTVACTLGQALSATIRYPAKTCTAA